MAAVQNETQLDRIERKLDEMIELKDVLLKIFLPRIPAAARETALRMLAKRGGGER